MGEIYINLHLLQDVGPEYQVREEGTTEGRSAKRAGGTKADVRGRGALVVGSGLMGEACPTVENGREEGGGGVFTCLATGNEAVCHVDQHVVHIFDADGGDPEEGEEAHQGCVEPDDASVLQPRQLGVPAENPVMLKEEPGVCDAILSVRSSAVGGWGWEGGGKLIRKLHVNLMPSEDLGLSKRLCRHLPSDLLCCTLTQVVSI